jgi:DNA-binding NarL/FixJ family response regulator
LLKRILIVDDSSLIRRNLRQTLQKANELRPDLIVLDLSMPVLNGLEAARNLQKTMPEVPLMLYSLHADNRVEKEARAIGFRSVLSKSAGTDVLIDEARNLLNANSP